MDNESIALQDNHIDDHVDDEITSYLFNNPTCFFAFAGAGSGKTTSLIKALNFIAENKGEHLRNYKKYVAVVTYTNAACDEIMRRANRNPIFKVSTIHSFLWELISNYQDDIKEWVIDNIKLENEKHSIEILKGRVGSQAQINREEKIQKNLARLSKIETIKRFLYNPNGENYGYDSLSHSQVIKMGSEFIEKNETMQKILITTFPIILVDESQDTKKELVDALVKMHELHNGEITIGMFGDTMQKIYTDGKDNLDKAIPESWARPIKEMNHRSGKRIVDLANAIRQGVDDKLQRSRSDAKLSFVRLFIANSSSDKMEVEQKVFQKMSEIADDADWLIMDKCKCLILEHHMAANRFGFSQLFTPLNEISTFDTQLRDGSLPELSFLSKIVLPIINAHKKNDAFQIAAIVEKNSLLLSKKTLQENYKEQKVMLEKADKAVDDLTSLWKDEKIPSCMDIYVTLSKSGIFELPSRISTLLQAKGETSSNDEIEVLKEALKAPFTQLENYTNYVSGTSSFDTHQGVKGLEFERVVVIMDDEEARGFLFSYDKLFGAKEKTATDIKNENEGKDTSIDRTRRLFYVACTRAKESLAVIAYTQDKSATKTTAINNAWFSKEEIEVL